MFVFFIWSLFDAHQSEDENEYSDDDDEAAMLEIDEMRSHRDSPLTKEQFDSYFDECGRLVNEHDFRKQIFKGAFILDFLTFSFYHSCPPIFLIYQYHLFLYT